VPFSGILSAGSNKKGSRRASTSPRNHKPNET
jgi:hypothetical protein